MNRDESAVPSTTEEVSVIWQGFVCLVFFGIVVGGVYALLSLLWPLFFLIIGAFSGIGVLFLFLLL